MGHAEIKSREEITNTLSGIHFVIFLVHFFILKQIKNEK
jgi:hypothetical protein